VPAGKRLIVETVSALASDIEGVNYHLRLSARAAGAPDLSFLLTTKGVFHAATIPEKGRAAVTASATFIVEPEDELTYRFVSDVTTSPEALGLGISLVRTEEAARKAVRERAKGGMDAIKITVESGPTPFGDDHPQMSVAMIRTIVEEAANQGLAVFAHVSSRDELKRPTSIRRVAVDGGGVVGGVAGHGGLLRGRRLGGQWLRHFGDSGQPGRTSPEDLPGRPELTRIHSRDAEQPERWPLLRRCSPAGPAPPAR